MVGVLEVNFEEKGSEHAFFGHKAFCCMCREIMSQVFRFLPNFCTCIFSVLHTTWWSLLFLCFHDSNFLFDCVNFVLHGNSGEENHLRRLELISELAITTCVCCGSVPVCDDENERRGVSGLVESRRVGMVGQVLSGHGGERRNSQLQTEDQQHWGEPRLNLESEILFAFKTEQIDSELHNLLLIYFSSFFILQLQSVRNASCLTSFQTVLKVMSIHFHIEMRVFL